MRTLPFTALLSLVGSTALASAVFPGTVQSHLELTQTPQCTICHATNAGGAGTVTRPFGEALRDRGVAGNNNTTKLTEALDQLESEAVDSDGDGVPDITELRNGTNPNVADAMPGEDGGTNPGTDGGSTGEECPGGVAPRTDGSCPPPPKVIPEPTYGCSTTQGGIAGLMMAALALLSVALRKRA